MPSIRKVTLFGVILMLVLSLAVVFAACGEDEAITTTSQEGSSSSSTPDTTTAGGTLKIGASEAITSFYAPIAPNRDSLYFDPVYDRLLQRMPDGSLEAGLALEWSNPDPLTVELKLREGLTFSDGEPFNAAAVVANYDNLQEPPANSGPAIGLVASVESCTAVDEYTVRYDLTSPDPDLVGHFSETEVGIMISPKALADVTKLGGEPAGVGPYNLDLEKTIPNQKYVYVKNPDYYNADAYPWDDVEIHVMLDNQARFNAIRTGQLDLAMGQLADVDTAEDAGLNVLLGTAEPLMITILDFNGDICEPLSDARVRQALCYAIDREAFVQAVLFGHGIPNSAKFPSPSQLGYTENLIGYYTHDVEKAKSLLAEAGYADGFKLPMIAEPWSQKQAEVVAGFLAEIGVTVDIDVRQTDLVSKIKAKEVACFANTAPTFASSMLASFYFRNSIFDLWGHGMPELEALYDAAMGLTDPAEVEEAWAGINKWCVENAVEIPLAITGQPVFYRQGVEVDSNPITSHPRLFGIRTLN